MHECNSVQHLYGCSEREYVPRYPRSIAWREREFSIIFISTIASTTARIWTGREGGGVEHGAGCVSLSIIIDAAIDRRSMSLPCAFVIRVRTALRCRRHKHVSCLCANWLEVVHSLSSIYGCGFCCNAAVTAEIRHTVGRDLQ